MTEEQYFMPIKFVMKLAFGFWKYYIDITLFLPFCYSLLIGNNIHINSKNQNLKLHVY